MDEKSSDPVKIATAVSRLVEVLAKFSPSDQNRAISAARAVLGNEKGSVGNESADVYRPKGDEKVVKNLEKESDHTDQAAFFDRGDKKANPSTNAFLCAAWHFKRYGTAAFSISEIKDIASQAGVIIPDRVDKTLQNAGKNGKKLFVSSGKQLFKPTASGAQFLQTEFSVRPGREAKPQGVTTK